MTSVIYFYTVIHIVTSDWLSTWYCYEYKLGDRFGDPHAVYNERMVKQTQKQGQTTLSGVIYKNNPKYRKWSGRAIKNPETAQRQITKQMNKENRACSVMSETGNKTLQSVCVSVIVTNSQCTEMWNRKILMCNSWGKSEQCKELWELESGWPVEVMHRVPCSGTCELLIQV